MLSLFCIIKIERGYKPQFRWFIEENPWRYFMNLTCIIKLYQILCCLKSASIIVVQDHFPQCVERDNLS